MKTRKQTFILIFLFFIAYSTNAQYDSFIKAIRKSHIHYYRHEIIKRDKEDYYNLVINSDFLRKEVFRKIDSIISLSSSLPKRDHIILVEEYSIPHISTYGIVWFDSLNSFFYDQNYTTLKVYSTKGIDLKNYVNRKEILELLNQTKADLLVQLQQKFMYPYNHFLFTEAYLIDERWKVTTSCFPQCPWCDNNH
jgi:hypothetical protein